MKSHPTNSRCGAPLVEMPCGCRLEVADLSGSPSLRAKLYAMGILPGTEMEVCRSGDGSGSVCVRVKQSSLVLGANLAKSILCRAIGENEVHNHHRRRSFACRHGGLGTGLLGWCKKHWAGRTDGKEVCCCEKK